MRTIVIYFFTHLKDLLNADRSRVLRHVSACPNPQLRVDSRKRGARPRDTHPTSSSDDICLWRHYKKLLQALRIATATDVEVDAPTTDPLILQAKHSYDMGTTAFGGWYSLYGYTKAACGCNGVYPPRTWTQLRKNGLIYVYYMLYKNASLPTCPAASCSRYPLHTSKNTLASARAIHTTHIPWGSAETRPRDST